MTTILPSGARRSRVVAVLGLGLALGSVALLPLSEGGDPFCPLRRWLGLPCLLCGGTRATQALLQGDWGRAFYLNEWVSLALILAVLWALVAALEAGVGRRLVPAFRWSPIKALGLILLLLICWGLHVASALRTPKPELLYEESVAAGIRAWWGRV